MISAQTGDWTCVTPKEKRPAFRGDASGLYKDNNGFTTALFCTLTGLADAGDAGSFSAGQGITGGCSAYILPGRRTIDTVSIASLQGRLSSGGDVALSGTGTALVGGVLTNIALDMEESGGFSAFELRDAGTAAVLASGSAPVGDLESGGAEVTLELITA
jgi:hypothetical protein